MAIYIDTLGSKVNKSNRASNLIPTREIFVSKPSIDSYARKSSAFSRKNSILKNNNSRFKRSSNANKKRINFDDFPQTETIELPRKKSLELDGVNLPENIYTPSHEPSKQNTDDFLVNDPMNDVPSEIYNKDRALSDHNNSNFRKVYPEEKLVTFIDTKKTFEYHHKEVEKIQWWNHMKDSSFFIFHKDSSFRVSISNIISSDVWETTITFLIIVNSVILAIDDPLDDPQSSKSIILYYLDLVCTSCFVLEMMFKIISMGFLFNSTENSNAYFRNTSNILDFFIVVISISAIVSQSENFRAIKSLRAFRAFRSIRFISKSDSLKIIVNATLRTLASLNSLFLIIVLLNFAISINTMNLWKGNFYYCSLNETSTITLDKIVDKFDCIQNDGLWINKRKNYDSFFNATLSLFMMVLNDGWLDLMYDSIDSNGIDKQPIKDNNPYYILLYFCLVVLCNFIVMNLFVSVVVDNFMAIKDELGGFFLLTKDQRQWVEMQRYMQKRTLKIRIVEPENRFKAFCFKIIHKKEFEIMVQLFVLFNLIILSCRYDGNSDIFEYFVIIINYFVLILFNIEFILKLYGLGINYFQYQWNR